jgi:hypothetical protein
MKRILSLSIVALFCINSLAQNVGISTNNPSSKVHITGSGTFNQIRIDDSASGATTRLNAAYIPNAVLPYIGTSTPHAFGIVTNNAYRVVIDANGKVGIGVQPPSATLEVAGDVVAAGPVTSHGNVFSFRNITAADTVRANKAVVTNGDVLVSGNLSIGLSRPSIVEWVQNAPTEITCNCPVGMMVLGGGASPLDPYGQLADIVINATKPSADGRGWTIVASCVAGVSRRVVVTAICARIK